MRSRHVLTAVSAAAALAVAACGSNTTDGQGSPGGGTGPGGNQTTPTSGGPTGAVSLATQMQSAVAGVTSAHITLDVGISGQSITGQGDETLSNGKLTGLDISETLPGGAGTLRLIVAGGKTYAKLPASLNSSGKPYVLISQNSSNPVVQQISSSLGSTLDQASVGNVNEFVTAAKSVKQIGTQTVNGVETTHYKVIVDPTKLPSAMSSMDAIKAAGITQIPVDLYIDSQGRPVKLTETVKASGQEIDVDVTIGDYNAPVSIKAPPASQVDTS